jgi:UPF0755 protein
VKRAAVRLCVCAAVLSCSPGPDAPRAHVYIPRGASLTAVADSLEAHGVIETAWTFRLYARLRGLARHVRAGLYAFPLGDRYESIVAKLLSGRTDDMYFTVAEGLTVRQIAELAADTLRLARDSVRAAIRDSFLAAARDPLLRSEFGIEARAGLKEPLEGYLLPETYRVVYEATPRRIVRQMVRQFLALWDTSFDRRAAAVGLTRHQALTLASIVEEETRIASERRTIAGVYLNRLRKHMPLQADPTVLYALDIDKRPARVLYRHLKVRSPYNSYLHAGLPPGPISNPGRAAIEAALAPQAHNLYYFVARPDGHHLFSRTSREHADSVAVARVLRAQYEARRDSLEAAALDSAARARRQSGGP